MFRLHNNNRTWQGAFRELIILAVVLIFILSIIIDVYFNKIICIF